jgi:trigger factor
MKVELETLSPCKRAVLVEVPQEEVAKEWNQAYLRLRQKVKVPGFRPGKAPLAIIETRFLPELKNETLRYLVHDYYNKALDELGIKAVNHPEVDEVDVQKNEPLKFKATFEVKPNIEIKDYKGLELKSKQISVSEKEIEDVLKHMQERNAQFISKEEGPAQEGDLVIIDFLATVNNKLIKEGKAQNYPLILGSKRLLDDIEKGLVGMKKGETKEIKVEFPAYHFNKEMAGKKVEFKVTVKDIKEKKIPPLDDELAKDIGGGVTLEEIKDKIRSTVEAEKKKEAEHAVRNAAIEKVLEKNSFELPESLVEYQLERYVEETTKNLQQKGLDFSLSTQGTESMKGKLKEAAEKRVRSYLALEAIAKQEKIEITPSDFDEEIKTIAGESEESLAALQSYLKDEEKRGGIEERIWERKAMDIILAHAKIEPETEEAKKPETVK